MATLDAHIEGRAPRRLDRPDWPEMAAGVVLSVLFHGAIVLTAVISMWWAGDEPQPDETYEVAFDDVELLALGEPPDPDAMPRLTGDEGTPPEPDEVAPEEPPVEPQPQPEPQPEPSADEPEPDPEQLERERREQQQREEQRRQRQQRQQRQRRMQEAVGQFETDGRGDEAPEGSPEGVAGGTVTDEDLADMEMTYRVRLLQAIERHWEIPTTIADDELAELAGKVVVSVQLSDDGHIVEYQFRQKSGNEQFDESIERVMRQFKADTGGRTLPMPEADEIRREIVGQGLNLSRWEHLER